MPEPSQDPSSKSSPNKPSSKRSARSSGRRTGKGRPSGRRPSGKKKHRVRSAHSAGGVAYRRVPTDQGEIVQVALIATAGGTRWQLPKGTIEAGETPEQTAVREVEEETGLKTVPEAFLKTTEYWYWDTYGKTEPVLVHKKVDYFLLRVVGGELTDSSFEVDGVGWFTPEEAIQTLTFDDDREVVKLAQQHWTGSRDAHG